MMKAATEVPPSTYARTNAHGLTLTQQNAVDLLAAGRNDTETAAELRLNRVTVTRWRLYSAEFRAALADQRAAIWGTSADRLRALLPKAIDALADALDQADETDRVTVALAVLKLAGPLPLVPAAPTDPEDVVRGDLEQERERLRAGSRGAIDRLQGLPEYDAHLTAVRKRLAKLAPPEDGPAEGEPTFRTGEGTR
jgi:hypothetical protein